MRRPVTRPGRQSRRPLSAGIVAEGTFLFISGQGPVDPTTGEFVLGTFAEQAALTLANVDAVARAAGTSLGRAVKVNAYLRDMANHAEFDRIYGEWVREPWPARTTVGADLPGFEIEIDAIVLLNGDVSDSVRA